MEIKAKIKSSGKSDNILKKLKKNLEEAPELLVGVPQDAIPYPDGTPVALVGAVHEFGSSNVPERSFIRTAINENLDKYIGMAERGSKKVVEGKLSFEQVANLIGTEAQGDIQDKITEISTPALAASTLRQREKKGSTPNPLVDTGQLRQSIRYEIRD
jgi:hypothetical protein